MLATDQAIRNGSMVNTQAIIELYMDAERVISGLLTLSTRADKSSYTYFRWRKHLATGMRVTQLAIKEKYRFFSDRTPSAQKAAFFTLTNSWSKNAIVGGVVETRPGGS